MNMKKNVLTLISLLVLMMTPTVMQATNWFDVLCDGGETVSLSPEISTTDGGASYLVWVRNSFDLPESRKAFTIERGYDKTVAYKLTLYKFTDEWNNFNIIQVSIYGEDDELIDQYANPDLAATESVIPAGSTIEAVAEVAKVIYEVKTNPE